MTTLRNGNPSKLLGRWSTRTLWLAALIFSLGWGLEATAEGEAGAAEEQPIRDVIEQYKQGWLTLDARLLQSIWDKDYAKIIYVAVELKDPIKGWAGVQKYYDDGTQYFGQVKTFALKDLVVDVFGDTGYAFATYRFEAVTKGDDPQTIQGDGQVSFLLRKVGGKWRLIQYHESAPHAH